MNTADIIGISRHRLGTDGEGVTTLVGFFGCPLRCRYCLNPACFSPETKRITLTPEQLYEKVKIDDLYFQATNGGVVFGGGEPLTHIPFLREFKTLCPPEWKLHAETSLNVPEEAIPGAAEIFDHFYIDCKDTNPKIYRSYTGKGNERMLSNLKTLLTLVPAERITVRLPLIPDYNTEGDRDRSEKLLREMGVVSFDRFVYRLPKT